MNDRVNKKILSLEEFTEACKRLIAEQVAPDGILAPIVLLVGNGESHVAELDLSQAELEQGLPSLEDLLASRDAECFAVVVLVNHTPQSSDEVQEDSFAVLVAFSKDEQLALWSSDGLHWDEFFLKSGGFMTPLQGLVHRWRRGGYAGRSAAIDAVDYEPLQRFAELAVEKLRSSGRLTATSEQFTLAVEQIVDRMTLADRKGVIAASSDYIERLGINPAVEKATEIRLLTTMVIGRRTAELLEDRGACCYVRTLPSGEEIQILSFVDPDLLEAEIEAAFDGALDATALAPASPDLRVRDLAPRSRARGDGRQRTKGRSKRKSTKGRK